MIMVGSGRIADFIDDYAGTTTNPSLDYAVQIKGLYGQPFMITGIGSVNSIPLEGGEN